MQLIVATSGNGMIGLEGSIPFNCKSDQAFFKAVTLGKVCHVGYNTYPSVKTLKNREFVVIGRDRRPFYQRGAVVIGGANTYKAYMELDYIDTIYLTQVCGATDGDTLLPECLLPDNLRKSKVIDESGIIRPMWNESLIMEKPQSDSDQYEIRIWKYIKNYK